MLRPAYAGHALAASLATSFLILACSSKEETPPQCTKDEQCYKILSIAPSDTTIATCVDGLCNLKTAVPGDAGANPAPTSNDAGTDAQ